MYLYRCYELPLNPKSNFAKIASCNLHTLATQVFASKMLHPLWKIKTLLKIFYINVTFPNLIKSDISGCAVETDNCAIDADGGICLNTTGSKVGFRGICQPCCAFITLQGFRLHHIANITAQTNHESSVWSMRIVDEHLWWHFWSVFYAVGLLPYAHRGHTRNDAHCRF